MGDGSKRVHAYVQASAAELADWSIGPAQILSALLLQQPNIQLGTILLLRASLKRAEGGSNFTAVILDGL